MNFSITPICITEKRAPVFGIAFASYWCQEPTPSQPFYTDYRRDEHDDYLTVARRILVDLPPSKLYWINGGLQRNDTGGPRSVPARLDRLIGSVNQMEPKLSDIFTIWDDDDYSPPTRLALTAKVISEVTKGDPTVPFVVSYDGGWFCNLRTMKGSFVNRSRDHLWGGGLTFNRAAWKLAGGFSGLPYVGYDVVFVNAARNIGAVIGKIEVSLGQAIHDAPVAFSHGKNVSTWLQPGDHVCLEPFLEKRAPAAVFAEIKRAQQFLIDHRVFPPQSQP